MAEADQMKHTPISVFAPFAAKKPRSSKIKKHKKVRGAEIAPSRAMVLSRPKRVAGAARPGSRCSRRNPSIQSHLAGM